MPGYQHVSELTVHSDAVLGVIVVWQLQNLKASSKAARKHSSMGPPKLLPPSPDPPMPTPPPFLSFHCFLHAPYELGTALLLGTQQVLGIEMSINKTLDVDKACLQLVLAGIRLRQAPVMLSAKTNT